MVHQAKLFVHPSWRKRVERAAMNGPSPAPPREWPLGDGSHGVLEGFPPSSSPMEPFAGWCAAMTVMGNVDGHGYPPYLEEAAGRRDCCQPE